jgi:hypothetical protein
MEAAISATLAERGLVKFLRSGAFAEIAELLADIEIAKAPRSYLLPIALYHE